MKRSRLLVVAVVILVVLAGCSGADSGSDDGQLRDEDTAVPEAEADEGGGSGDGAGDTEEVKSGSSDGGTFDSRAKSQARYRIKTADIELEVESYRNTRNTLVAEAQTLGGYVDSETSDRHTRGNETWTTGTVVMRVPSENYDRLLETVAASGTVEHKETRTRDVTERVVDLQARLTNLKRQRDRLRDLYESANETEDILRVGDRLSEVQGEIERVEGRLQILENQVAYSTVRVHINEERPEGRIGAEKSSWYETSVFAAFIESVQGVIVFGRMVVVGVAYLAPYAFALGIPVAGIYGLARRYG